MLTRIEDLHRYRFIHVDSAMTTLWLRGNRQCSRSATVGWSEASEHSSGLSSELYAAVFRGDFAMNICICAGKSLPLRRKRIYP